MGFDNAYSSITDDDDVTDDHRWAFGTGFADPIDGLDGRVPDGVEAADVSAYCLMLGDDALVMSHRLQEWVTRAPELEEETALANIALDLLGQARVLLSRAGEVGGAGRDEDDLAFLREFSEFRNVNFVEPVDIDFAALQARLFVFSTWRLAAMARLCMSRDPILAALASKSVSELAYHRDYAAQWVVRLGDGTDYSARRIRESLVLLSDAVGELFAPSDVERRLAEAGVAVDAADLRAEFDEVVAQVCAAATIDGIAWTAESCSNGRAGAHTVELASLLDELQGFARQNAGATW